MKTNITPALIQAHDPATVRENSADLFVKSKGKHYICSAFHTDRRVLLVFTGIFYALYIRFCTPVWSVNAPTAYQVESSGKGRTVFNFCLN